MEAKGPTRLQFQLGALNLCTVPGGVGPATVLRDAIEIARAIEVLGYSRYWIAEHHNSRVAHSSPSVLIAVIAKATEQICIGAAGVLLQHHSTLRIANDFRVLSSIFPNRIDLGIARAQTGATVARYLWPELDGSYDQRLDELLALLQDAGPVQAVPLQAPPVYPWLLGSNTQSMRLAAERGLPFCLAGFIPNCNPEVATIAQEYRDTFRPTEANPRPVFWVALAGACSIDERSAFQISDRQLDAVVPKLVGSPNRCWDTIDRLQSTAALDGVAFLDLHSNLAERLASFASLIHPSWAKGHQVRE